MKTKSHSKPQLSTSWLVAALLLLWVSASALQAQRLLTDTSTTSNELIVLLAPVAGEPLADEVVRATRQRTKVPGSLGFGAPESARFGLPTRTTGKFSEQLRQDHDSPRARLERYVVLSYPPGTDLDLVRQTLMKDPQVLHVEENLVSTYSATPNDPLFAVTGDPNTHQWGSYSLNLPAAWDRVKGHGYVGLIDNGVEVGHPDLGNFREHFSYDFANDDDCVDERDACDAPVPPHVSPTYAGHGTHVAGLVAASTDNAEGIAGSCWNCSLMITKGGNGNLLDADIAASLTFLVDHGAQIISMSFGRSGASCDNIGSNNDLGMVCTAIAHADSRSVLMTAASGNNKIDIAFPALDPRIMAIGGIESDLSFWDEAPNCPLPGTQECGSNYTVTPGSAMQDLVAPAKGVVSTMYTDFDWNLSLGCGDGTLPNDDGYGRCTGTSMASPYLAGVAGLVRSINPLLTKDEVRDALITTADGGGSWDPKFGYGIPNSAAAVERALGVAASQPLSNRLAPLFSLYSTSAEDFLYTSVPQMASAAIWSPTVAYGSVGPAVPGYPLFPHGCSFSPCGPFLPKASVFLFTSHTAPYAGAPPLVPLYRLSYEGTNPGNGNALNRDTVYTTDQAGINAFVSLGYRLDGTEGYLFSRSGPQPPDTVRLFRKYNPTRDDHAIFPESELPAMLAQGYTQNSGNDWIGYVYPNTDTDSDLLIDGFERLAGTDPAVSDTDGDGLSDGDEVLAYPYSDPLDGLCSNDLIFADSFEIPDTPQWDSVVTIAGGTIKVSDKAAFSGNGGLLACLEGSANDRAYVGDLTPNQELQYRTRFYFSPAELTMDMGSQHSIFVLRSATQAIVRIGIQRTATGYEIRARSRLDNGTWSATQWFGLSGGWQAVEIDWRAATAAPANGHLKLWLDGQLQQEILGLDNDLMRGEQALLGATAGVDTGTKGCHKFDEFESRRCQFIGL